MGDLRFRVPEAVPVDPRAWETAYISGIEGIPWFCHRTLEGNQFTIGRNIEESGKLNIVWPTRTLGLVCLSTTSLRIVDGTYSLLVELARGTVYRLKNQCEEWQRIGLRLPSEFFSMAENALKMFLRAVTSKDSHTEQDALAQASIDFAIEASCLLCNSFGDQVLDMRRQNEGRFSTLLGVNLQRELSLASIGTSLRTAFNLVGVEADLNSVEVSSGRRDFTAFDHQVAWAQEQGLRICVGPLVNFRPGGLPKWMVLLNEGFETILRAACQHAEQTVQRYRGRAHLWNCAAGLNAPGDFAWSDEEVLRLSVSLIETVRRADDRSPVLLSIDQPWSEYLGSERDGISPLHFADALIRADLGLSGLALEINLNMWPNGTLPRDPIEIGRLVDRWAALGLPLMIILTQPADEASDPAATIAQSVAGWNSGMPRPYGLGTDSLLRLLLSKPTVHAVVWNQTSDQVPHRFPHAGLWDQFGKPRAILGQAARLRQTFLH